MLIRLIAVALLACPAAIAAAGEHMPHPQPCPAVVMPVAMACCPAPEPVCCEPAPVCCEPVQTCEPVCCEPVGG